jgi:hypothetical protein
VPVTERERAGGLDDLFAMVGEPDAEERPEPAERPRSRVLWVIRNLLLIAVATVVTVAVLRSIRLGVSVPVVAAAFVALRLLMLAVAEVAPPPAPKPVAQRATADIEGLYQWTGTDSLRSAVHRWEQRLEWSRSDPDAFARSVLPMLGELADERLRLHHGITRALDPRRARELLGEPLWLALDDPGRRRLRDMVAFVETLERLGEGVHR